MDDGWKIQIMDECSYSKQFSALNVSQSGLNALWEVTDSIYGGREKRVSCQMIRVSWTPSQRYPLLLAKHTLYDIELVPSKVWQDHQSSIWVDDLFLFSN